MFFRLCPWVAGAGFAVGLAAQPPSAYRIVRTLHPGGEGGWDYLTVDAAHQLLFVPRVTHTQVLDASSGALVADILGQKHNHGVAIVPSAGRGFISDGDDGAVVIFDLKTYQLLGKVKAEADADGIIYDAATNKVLLVSGDAGVLIPIAPDVDPKTGSVDPEIDLGGKPEYLAVDGRGRAYVNLEDKDMVAVVDLKAAKVVAKWPTAPGGSPVGLAIDPANGRLFIGCRKPQQLIVMSTANGKILADLPIGSGVDATGFAGDAYASCGDGTLTVVREVQPGQFRAIEQLKTATGARTLGLDPQSHTLYLATAEFEAPAAGKRRVTKPGTFKVLVVDASPGR